MFQMSGGKYIFSVLAKIHAEDLEHGICSCDLLLQNNPPQT